MAETILLNGVFRDDITPQLKKLQRQIDALNKSFTKFGKKLRPIARDLGKVAVASERLVDSMKDQKMSIDAASRSWVNYRKQVGKAGSATRGAFPRGAGKPPSAPRGGAFPTPVATGGRQRGGGGGMGILGGAASVFLGGAGLMAVTSAFYSISNAARQMVAAGTQAEQGIIRMAGTLQTLGKMGDWNASMDMANTMLGDVARIAAALPGSTRDYLTILEQTLDDQIQAFGSVEAVTKNLAEGERSFTALYGMTAQIAGLRPQLAAMDLNQLRTNPQSIRNIQVLTRNPTLQKFYLAELRRNGGDWFKALKFAMEKAITPEQIEALKQSFDSAYQSAITELTDSTTGLFGMTRKFTVELNGVVQEGFSAMQQLGMTMRAFGESVNLVVTALKDSPFDPMIIFTKILYKIEVIAWTLYYVLEDLENGLYGSFEDFIRGMGYFVGSIFTQMVNWVMNLDYNQFFKYVDEFVAGFFEAMKDQIKFPDMGEGLFGTFGGSISGTIFSIILFTTVITKAIQGVMFLVSAVKGIIAGFTAVKLFLVGLPALIGGWLGAVVPFILTVLAPVLAVAGAFMLVIAIVRNFGDILKLLGAGIKLWWASTKKLWLSILKLFLQGIDKILGFLGMGHLADQALIEVDKQIEQATAEQTAAQKEASDALQGMADQFQQDSKAIKDFFTMGNKGAFGVTEDTPGTYTVSGVTYDAATGRPISGTGAQTSGTTAAAAVVPSGPTPVTIPEEANPVPVLEKIETQSTATVAAAEKIETKATETVTKAVEAINKANTDLGLKINENKTKVAESSSTLTSIYTLMQQGMKVDIVKSIPIPMQLSLGGAPGAGSDQGGPSVFNGMASMMGLMMTSGYRPNDEDSYHGINRARDYAGDPAQMLAFAQMMSQTFGGTLKELIYTPLGYSIKNGQIVPPYAQGTHYDHVHVAYGMGAGSPAFFSSQSAAQSWERRVAPSNSAIASVTSNSSEMGGGNVTVGAINISGVNDPKAIAETVAEEIMVALDRSSYTSLYNS